MNNKNTSKNPPFEIVDVFNYGEKTCVIVRVNFLEIYRGHCSHNGYVSLKKPDTQNNEDYEKSYEDYQDLAEDGLTYNGYLGREYKRINTKENNLWLMNIPEDMYFFGFDTLHAWNDEYNSSYSEVRRKTIKLAAKMIEKGI